VYTSVLIRECAHGVCGSVHTQIRVHSSVGTGTKEGGLTFVQVMLVAALWSRPAGTPLRVEI
jgi:hypothetical protein